MTFKIPPIEIPENDPFQYDALERRPSVEALQSVIDEVSGPFVVAVNSPWGTGKTTFVRILKSELMRNGYSCLYFNAWASDFSEDPLVAFLGEIDSLVNATSSKGPKLQKQFQKAKKVATILAKRAIPVAGKIVTAGILDLESFSEEAIADYVSGSLADAIDAYTAQRQLIEQFRESLSGAMDELLVSSSKEKIIIFVDELDRCRPNYAIDLLERIKHLFDLENVVFVLSVDKSQLGISLGAVYGDKIDSDEYLRRFIDLEFKLPRPDSKAFSVDLFKRFGFEDIFSKRSHETFRGDAQELVESFSELSELLNLSLRAREQCFTTVRIALMLTPDNYHIYPLLLATLVVLRTGAPDVYAKYCSESGTASDVIDFLGQLPGGRAMLEKHSGAVTEAYLVATKTSRYGNDPGELGRYRQQANDESVAEDQRARPAKIVEIADHMLLRDRVPSLGYLVNKLELASRFEG